MRTMELVKSAQFNGVTLDCYIESGKDSEYSSNFWATREQIGRLLEYAEPMKAIAKIHERKKERLDKFSTVVKLTTVEGERTVTREVIMYNFKGLLEICRYSDKPKANAVIDFLWNIADEIRRTGSYGKHELDALTIRAAEVLQKIGSFFTSHRDKELLARRIYELVMGEEMPVSERPLAKVKRIRPIYSPLNDKWLSEEYRYHAEGE